MDNRCKPLQPIASDPSDPSDASDGPGTESTLGVQSRRQGSIPCHLGRRVGGRGQGDTLRIWQTCVLLCCWFVFFFSMCFDLFLLELVRILRACGIPSVHLFSIKCLFLCYLVVFVARSGKRRHRVRKCMAVVEAFPNILLLFFISPTIIYT